MRFILWTAVYLGMNTLADFVAFGFPSKILQHKMYSQETIALAALVDLFLWLFLYVKFVRTED